MAPSSGDDQNSAGSQIGHEDAGTDEPTAATPERKTLRSRVETTIAVSWEAPLPPPALLEQYDQIVPGLASEIVKRAEVEGGHLRHLDEAAFKAAVGYRTRGQWMGFGAVVGILGVSALALVEGAYWVAGIALTIATGTAAVFVVGSLRNANRKDRGEKSDPPPAR